MTKIRDDEPTQYYIDIIKKLITPYVKENQSFETYTRGDAYNLTEVLKLDLKNGDFVTFTFPDDLGCKAIICITFSYIEEHFPGYKSYCVFPSQYLKKDLKEILPIISTYLESRQIKN